MYCLKCKQQTDTENETIQTTKNGGRMACGTCTECNTKKCKFLPKAKAKKNPKK